MELIQGSETSANYNLTPGKYPKEHTQYSNHGESLKSRIKINVYTSDSYRRLTKQFQADVIHHTYQPRGERAYRVVQRHLHHTIHPDVIKGELESLRTNPAMYSTFATD
jgi:hypothetical protein